MYRILQVTGVMDRGGAETMIMNLYRNIDRNELQFDFVENSLEEGVYDSEILSLGGKIFHCVHWNGKNTVEYVKWWKAFWKEYSGKYKIVHGHIGSTAAIYLKIAADNGAFTIAHSHNTLGGLDIKSVFYRAVSYPARYIADYFMACSEAAGLSRYGHKVAQGDRYRLLHNAIDTAQFSFNAHERDTIRSELGYEKDSIVIGHVGRFEKQKNHSFLIDIFSELLKHNKRVYLLLVGDGSLKREIMAKIKEQEIEDRVILLGVRTDINRLLQGMDVFVFPSLYEGLPVTLVEAQTSGVPCVISDRIPKDAVLIEDLISTLSLKRSPEQWAVHIDRIINHMPERRDYSAEMTASGFDIHETAKWLEDFYFEHMQ